jgi:thiol-disulfide isomerase/thioredoxin
MIPAGTEIRGKFEIQLSCAVCGGSGLWRLDEASSALVSGWKLWCPYCRRLVLDEAEASAALRDRPPDSLGVVVAVDFPLERSPLPHLR